MEDRLGVGIHIVTSKANMCQSCCSIVAERSVRVLESVQHKSRNFFLESFGGSVASLAPQHVMMLGGQQQSTKKEGSIAQGVWGPIASQTL